MKGDILSHHGDILIDTGIRDTNYPGWNGKNITMMKCLFISLIEPVGTEHVRIPSGIVFIHRECFLEINHYYRDSVKVLLKHRTGNRMH